MEGHDCCRGYRLGMNEKGEGRCDHNQTCRKTKVLPGLVNTYNCSNRVHLAPDNPSRTALTVLKTVNIQIQIVTSKADKIYIMGSWRSTHLGLFWIAFVNQ